MVIRKSVSELSDKPPSQREKARSKSHAAPASSPSVAAQPGAQGDVGLRFGPFSDFHPPAPVNAGVRQLPFQTLFTLKEVYMKKSYIILFGVVLLASSVADAGPAPPLSYVQIRYVGSSTQGWDPISDNQLATNLDHGGPLLRVLTVEVGYGFTPVATMNGARLPRSANYSTVPFCSSSNFLTACQAGQTVIRVCEILEPRWKSERKILVSKHFNQFAMEYHGGWHQHQVMLIGCDEERSTSCAQIHA